MITVAVIFSTLALVFSLFVWLATLGGLSTLERQIKEYDRRYLKHDSGDYRVTHEMVNDVARRVRDLEQSPTEVRVLFDYSRSEDKLRQIARELIRTPEH